MKRKSLLKIVLFVLVLVLLVMKGIPLAVNYYLNANAEEIVSNMITRTNDFGGHEVHFGDIRVDYDYRGTFLQLSEVIISPGETITGKNKIRFNLHFEEASLTGFSWFGFLFQNSIQLDSAHIQNLTVESITPPLDSLIQNKETRTDRAGTDYDQVAVKRVRINRVSFENKDSYTDSTRLSVTDLFVFGDGFILTKEDLDNPEARFQVDHIEGYLNQAAVHLNGFRNVVYANDLSFNTADKKMNIDQLRFNNKLSKYDYASQFKYETDWIQLKEAGVTLEEMDFQLFLRKGDVKAGKLQIKDMEIEVFRDKRKPENFGKRPAMIHEIFRDLPLQLDFQEVEVSNGYVSYEERPENDAPRSGKLFFDEINASILGATNLPENIETNDEMKLNASGRLIGEGKIDLEVTYFLSDTTGKFLMKGTIGGMDLVKLNTMIEPATKVSLKQGKMNGLFFDINANDLEGTGEVIIKYEDLEIEILDGNFGYDQNIFQRIGSFLANKLIIKSQNPDKDELKKGEVYYLRDQHKFIFNYWWKLILSGLKSTLTGNTEEDMREKAQKSD